MRTRRARYSALAGATHSTNEPGNEPGNQPAMPRNPGHTTSLAGDDTQRCTFAVAPAMPDRFAASYLARTLSVRYQPQLRAACQQLGVWPALRVMAWPGRRLGRPSSRAHRAAAQGRTEP